MTKPRANFYKIERLVYEPPQDYPKWDWLCVLAWLGLAGLVGAFWIWVGLGRVGS